MIAHPESEHPAPRRKRGSGAIDEAGAALKCDTTTCPAGVKSWVALAAAVDPDGARRLAALLLVLSGDGEG